MIRLEVRIRLWMSLLLACLYSGQPAVFCQQGGMKIRRVFVPEAELQQLIRGRYLPLKLETLDGLLDRYESDYGKIGFRKVSMQLNYSLENTLNGTIWFELEDELLGKEIALDSNFIFSNPSCLDREFSFPVIGRSLKSGLVFSAVLGKRFRCDVQFPVPPNSRNFGLMLPLAIERNVSIAIPDSLTPLSISPVEKLSFTPVAARAGISHYRISSPDSMLQLSLVETAKRPDLVTTTNEIKLEQTRMNWLVDLEISPRALAAQNSEIWFDSRMQCEAVYEGDKSVEFVTNRREQKRNSILLRPSQLKSQKIKLRLVLAGPLFPQSDLQNFSLVTVGEEKVNRAKLKLLSTTNWEVQELSSKGLRIVGIDSNNGMQLIQSEDEATFSLKVKPRQQEEFTDILEWDLDNENLIVRQLVRGLEKNAVVKLKNEFEILKIVSVNEPEAELPFSIRQTSEGKMVQLDGEFPDVWLVSRRKLDAVSQYRALDFAPAKVGEQNAMVHFEAVVLEKLVDELEFKTGFPPPIVRNGIEFFQFSNLGDLRFRLPTDYQNLGVSTSSVVRVDLGNAGYPIEYRVGWNAEEQDTIILELDSKEIKNVFYNGRTAGTGKRLSGKEKNRLGLSTTREFWRFKMPKNELIQEGFVTFWLPAQVNQRGDIELVLPQSVGETDSQGLVEVDAANEGDFKIVDRSLIEIPGADKSKRRFQFSNQRKAVISPGGENDQEGDFVFHVISNRLRVLDHQKSVVEIDLVSRHLGGRNRIRKKTFSISCPGNLISRVVYRQGSLMASGRSAVGANENFDWMVQWASANEEISFGKLEIELVTSDHWDGEHFSLPKIMLNQRPVAQECIVTVEGDYTFVNFGDFVGSDVTSSLRHIFYLPALGLDTDTAEHFFGKDSSSAFVRMSPGANRRGTFLIPARSLKLIAILWFSGSCLISFVLKRSRYILYGTLLILGLVFLLAGIYSLLSAMSFWGFGLGLMIRELKRLCSFSTEKRAAIVASLGGAGRAGVLFCAMAPGISFAQDNIPPKPVLEKKSGLDAKIVPVFIPVDDQEKPTGFAYLPAELYSRLVLNQKSVGSLIFSRIALELLPESDSKKLSARVRFSIWTDKASILQIPSVIENAIYDSEAVKVDNVPLVFRPPDSENQYLEIRLNRSGSKEITIDVQVPYKSDQSVGMTLPFSGWLFVNNRSGEPFSVVPIKDEEKKTDLPAIDFPVDVGRWISSGKKLSLKRGSVAVEGIDVIERLDVSRSPAIRTIIITSQGPLSEPLRFNAAGGATILDSSDPVSFQGNELSVSLKNKKRLVLEFEENLFMGEGVFSALPLRSNSHPIERHYIILAGLERFEVSGDLAYITPDEWSRIRSQKAEWDLPAAWNDNGLIVNGKDRNSIKVWLSRAPGEIDCLVKHHYFLYAHQVALLSEFEVSCSAPTGVVTFLLNESVEDLEFFLGDRQLNWIRSGKERVTVFAGFEQSGRYQIQVTGKFPIADSWVDLFEPILECNSYQGRSFVWTGRERVVKQELAREPGMDPPRTGFLLAGTVEPENRRLLTGNNVTIAELEVVEDVAFSQGKISHQLTCRVPEANEGQWFGLVLPENGDLTIEEEKRLTHEYQAIIEAVKSFPRKQIWIPVNQPQKIEIAIRFSQPLDGNRIEFVQPVNTTTMNRQLVLPTVINDRLVNWTIDEFKQTESNGMKSVWQGSQSRVVGRFDVKAESTKPLDVKFGEIGFDNDSGKVHARFFIVPDDSGTITISIPEFHFVESVEVCGVKRSLLEVEDNVYRVQLLNNRFFQFVDLYTYIDKRGNYGDFQLDLPVIPQSKGYPVFLQCDENVTPSGLKKESFQSVLDRRAVFADSAISNFELNLDGAEGWLVVLESCLGWMVVDPVLLERFNKRLSEYQGVSLFLDLEFDERNASPVLVNRLTYLLESGSVNILKAKKNGGLAPRFWILSCIVLIGALATYTVRLPHWFRAPVFSFVMICTIWVSGVTWVFITPESMFAWCWILFASLFVVLVLIDAVLKIRSFVRMKSVQHAAGPEGSVKATNTQSPMKHP